MSIVYISKLKDLQVFQELFCTLELDFTDLINKIY